jgi:CheY-like chemotaxis protein
MELRVFLVEDIERMHGLLQEVFDSFGGVVVGKATTEAEAILWLDDHKGGWDLAVIDLVLDQGAGLNVIHRCKEDPTGGRIVVFSSYASPAVRQRCVELGADAVFDKDEPREFIGWCSQLASRENSGP